MNNATTSGPTWTATLTSPHNDPHLHVTIGSATVRLSLDLDRLLARQQHGSSLVSAAITEAVVLLRRTGCAPAGRWARASEDRNAFTVAIQELPGRCETCVHGCECRVGREGCGHLGCRGVRARALADSCPGVGLLRVSPRQMHPRSRNR